MPRPKRWTFQNQGQGIWEVRLHSWKYFSDFIRDNARLLAQRSVFRGHAAASWRLEPSLDRTLRRIGKLKDAEARQQHLATFKLAARGRRAGAELVSDDDWWALGQHHGLVTPLLDWTRSPFVGLYFAYESVANDGDAQRAVWTLNLNTATWLNKRIVAATKDKPADELRVVEPLSNDNARLVNQGGLFTRGPDGVPLDDWVRTNWPEGEKGIVLTKISCPSSGRMDCLRYLNAMNINQRSLFPDLSGASLFCNMQLAIDRY